MNIRMEITNKIIKIKPAEIPPDFFSVAAGLAAGFGCCVLISLVNLGLKN
jgi:hypothetical protein